MSSVAVGGDSVVGDGSEGGRDWGGGGRGRGPVGRGFLSIQMRGKNAPTNMD